MALTGNSNSKVQPVAPLWRELLSPVAGSKQLVHSTSETWWKCELCMSCLGPQLPPSNGYGPYRILAVCRIYLWPAVRTELGQEEWLRSPVNREQRGLIVAGDQGSRRGYDCSEMALTDNHSSKVWVAPPGHELLPSVAGSKWLVHWTSETWWKFEKCRRSTLCLILLM